MRIVTVVVTCSGLAVAGCSKDCPLVEECPPRIYATVPFSVDELTLNGARIEVCRNGDCVHTTLVVTQKSHDPDPEMWCNPPPNVTFFKCSVDAVAHGIGLEFPAFDGDTVHVRVTEQADDGTEHVVAEAEGTMTREQLVKETCSSTYECTQLVLR